MVMLGNFVLLFEQIVGICRQVLTVPFWQLFCEWLDKKCSVFNGWLARVCYVIFCFFKFT